MSAEAFLPPPMPSVVKSVPSGPVLVVAPHPDDEFMGPGGTLLHHARQGDPIRIVFVCSGVHGDPDGHYDAEEYPRLRADESRRAAERFLGTTDLHFYGYPDSLDDLGLELTFPGLPDDPSEKRRVLIEGLARDLKGHIATLDPRCIYYPWPGEFHVDHWAVGAAVDLLVRHEDDLLAGRSALAYEVWTTLAPQLLVDTTDTHAERLDAIGVFESQLRYRDYGALVTGLAAHRGVLLSESGRLYAEAFLGSYEPRSAP